MARVPAGRLTEADLVRLANRWEPEASSSPPGFRLATCVECAEPMTRMWHLWVSREPFRKEMHMCSRCARGYGLDDTLIVVAAFDHDYDENLDTMRGGTVIRADTSHGGHPSQALVDAYRAHADFTSYLLVQDSMEGIADDVVAPFREHGADVVAWVTFGFNFDDDTQAGWVRCQYPDVERPALGIFGPVFYATREALEAAEPWFPTAPSTKLEAQGTERAWAYAFKAAGIEVGGLHGFDPGGMSQGLCPPFRKVFADRP